MFKSIWSIIGVFMMIPIIVINHVIPDSMMEEETRIIIVLILLTIQVLSVCIFAFKTRREFKREKAKFEKERDLLDIRIKNHNKT